MDKENLLKEISQTLQKNKVEKLADLACKKHYLISDLIDLTFYKVPEIAFRAAWILDYIESNSPDQFLPFLHQFMDVYPQQKNLSCQRHYTKIMMHLTSNKSSKLYKAAIKHIDFELVVGTSFEWLVDQKTPVAVKVNCMEILFNLIKCYDWISEELKLQIEFLLRDGSAAIQSRGKKIIRQIKIKS